MDHLDIAAEGQNAVGLARSKMFLLEMQWAAQTQEAWDIVDTLSKFAAVDDSP